MDFGNRLISRVEHWNYKHGDNPFKDRRFSCLLKGS